MILSILIIAFAWLMYETDWLRVRLPVGLICKSGECCDWRLSENQVTSQMINELLCKWDINKVQRAMFDSGHLKPLFGWAFAYQYRNLMPEYKIELIDEHSKYTMRTESMPVLRDAFRVYRNPYLKVKLHA